MFSMKRMANEMFFPVETYYIVEDIQNRNRNLAVVCEADSRAEVEHYIRAHRLSSCYTFKESGEERYRGICSTQKVKSDEDNLVKKE